MSAKRRESDNSQNAKRSLVRSKFRKHGVPHKADDDAFKSSPRHRNEETDRECEAEAIRPHDMESAVPTAKELTNSAMIAIICILTGIIIGATFL